MISRIHIIPLAVLILAPGACIPKAPGGAGSVAASTEGTEDGSKCGADGVIDDGEDNNNQSAAQKGRGGYWYTFADKEGSTITPTAGALGGTFSMAAGGANGSAFAARFNGTLAKGQTIYAGAGVNFVDPKGPYDASAYKGVSFWAKKGEGSTGKVRLKLPDVNTDQDGKVCTECFNDFGVDLELTSSWVKYNVSFASLRQETGWGNPRPPALDASKVFGIQWQVRSPGESFDIWVDDVEFTGCSSPQGAGGGVVTSPRASGAARPGGGNNLLKNSEFEDGTSLPWTTSFTAPADGKASVDKGAFCLDIKERGANAWDAQVRHREMVIRKGHTYSIQFKAYASRPTKVRPKVGMSGPPYAEYWSSTIELKETPQRFAGQFTMGMTDDATAELAFHMGGALASAGPGLRVCLDDIRLDDPDFTPPPKPVAIKHPNVRVNQVGYFPGLVKKAVIKNASRAPVAWELVGEGGGAVASGTTSVFGEDAAAGEHVHIADFSTFVKPGDRFLLKVEGEGSYPFEIKRTVYNRMKYDALAYFYHNRSGVPIAMPYAGRDDLARPAGHMSDKSVACAPGTGCSYSLDVSGGWYDAGDHGKYVVNGGISVWTMLNQYERAKFAGGALADFGDGKLAIPENKNGVPDILDEARWQMEFMLRMQVPAGNPRAGMVHHKVHNEKWTALGMAPHEDPIKRYLRPPSTAATLNLAATAAQAARIWKGIDGAFSAKCLAAAEAAWAAAQANPAVYAPASDNTGGGPYGDNDVTDEFYWAAAELFITTGGEAYRTYLTKSPHKATIASNAGGGFTSAMAWQVTQSLGTISLAVVPSGIDKATLAAARASITAAADSYLAAIESQGYRLPFKPSAAGKYPWGSNSFALNNMIILALAHDFTGNVKYLNGAVEGMDYLLGKNPLVQSYVTGYGENPLKNPHHRFWSNQVNEKYPTAPAGALSGGPNSGLEDPYVQAAGLAGCAPQKCFVDHIEAWSANEITINWNAPFAWITAYLDEKGR